jgi:hypothetical protein
MKKVTLKSVVAAITAAQSQHDSVIAMIPSIKAAGITEPQLRDELKVTWNFADLSAKRKDSDAAKAAYFAVANKISYWAKTIFGSSMSEEAKQEMKKSMIKGRKAKIMTVLEEFNIDKKTAAKIAAKLVS